MSFIHFLIFKSQSETIPDICDTAAILVDEFIASQFSETAVASPNPFQSIETIQLSDLKSHIFKFASFPTLAKKDPSKLGLMQKMPLECASKLRMFFPVSVSHTFKYGSFSPPEIKFSSLFWMKAQ